jgi:regulator of replication initiation timing
MENIETLSMRIRKTIEKLKKLIDENNKLKLEVVYLRKENERSRKDANEYITLKKNTEEVAAKIEKIINKIDVTKV